MNTIQITLPDPVKNYVEKQVASGAYGSVSDFLCKVILDAKAQEDALQELLLDREKLEGELLQGIQSGPLIPATPDFWAERERKLASRTAGT